MIVEIFKTNVQDKPTAEKIIAELDKLCPHCQFNFDLEDCDKILRVESHNIIDNTLPTIFKILSLKGIDCELLK